jgi:hypothetical protein
MLSNVYRRKEVFGGDHGIFQGSELYPKVHLTTATFVDQRRRRLS